MGESTIKKDKHSIEEFAERTLAYLQVSLIMFLTTLFVLIWSLFRNAKLQNRIEELEQDNVNANIILEERAEQIDELTSKYYDYTNR